MKTKVKYKNSKCIPDYICLEYVDCPICGSKKFDILFEGNDRLYGFPGIYSVVECGSCELIRTNPRPTQETIGYYYPSAYKPYLNTRITNKRVKKKYTFFKKIIRKIENFILEKNTQVIPKKLTGNMLEVGCASGAYLAYMSRLGWRVEGIEFSKNAAKNAKKNGFDVQVSSLENATKMNNQYDLIVAWMVVEHLHDPVGALSKLSEWIKPEGCFIFSIPNASSFDFKIFKGNGYSLHLPAHLYHFTPETIKLTLNKSGWDLIEIKHHRVLGNIFGSIGLFLESKKAPLWLVSYFKNYPGGSHKIINSILHPIGFTLALFGQTGRMTVYAKKKIINKL